MVKETQTENPTKFYDLGLEDEDELVAKDDADIDVNGDYPDSSMGPLEICDLDRLRRRRDDNKLSP